MKPLEIGQEVSGHQVVPGMVGWWWDLSVMFVVSVEKHPTRHDCVMINVIRVYEPKSSRGTIIDRLLLHNTGTMFRVGQLLYVP